MDGKAQAVGLGGLVLVGVNAWTGPQRPALSAVLNGKSAAVPAAHTSLLHLGGEILLVVVLSLAADSSDAVGTGMIAALTALWILWAIRHYTGVPATYAIAGTPANPNTPTTRTV